jgi:hypothetical protein
MQLGGSHASEKRFAETDCVAGHIEVAPTNVFNDLRVKSCQKPQLNIKTFPAQCQKRRVPAALDSVVAGPGECGAR